MHKTEYNDVKANLIKKSLEQNDREVFVPVERRKGEDGILQFINLMSFLVWALVIMAIAIISKAGKSIGYITNNGLLWLPGSFWKIDLLKTSLIATIISICICTISIMLNFSRHRRRTDRIRRSLIICELISFIIGVFLVIKLF